MAGMVDPAALAAAAHAALRDAAPIPPFTGRGQAISLAEAYAAAARLRALRGRPVLGRKIGFTNRALWPLYGVDGPIWGDVTDETLIDAAALTVPVPLSPFAEPRIEPEIALGLSAAPRPGMDMEALAGCVGWVAPAFEIVQSIFPGWRFATADAVIAGGLHGRLILGPRLPATPALIAGLPDLALSLRRDGAEVEAGAGRNALGGPLSALLHLAEGLAAFDQPPLSPGEVVTTGTLTDAWPIGPGEEWTARFTGAADVTLTVAFERDAP